MHDSRRDGMVRRHASWEVRRPRHRDAARDVPAPVLLVTDGRLRRVDRRAGRLRPVRNRERERRRGRRGRIDGPGRSRRRLRRRRGGRRGGARGNSRGRRDRHGRGGGRCGRGRRGSGTRGSGRRGGGRLRRDRHRRCRRSCGRRWRRRGRNRRCTRGRGQEAERIEIALVVGGRADAEVHVGDVELRHAARPHRAHDSTLRDGGAARDGYRAEMGETDRETVRRLDRHALPARRHRAREADGPCCGSDDGRPVGRADRDAAMLARVVGMPAVERKPLQDRPVNRPCPGRGEGHDGQKREDVREEPPHEEPPPCCQI